VVAQDAQYKFLRFGVPTAAYTDARLQAMAAGALQRGDVVVAISGTGKATELVKAVDAALERGARVIALCPSHSLLARRATIAIAIDHPENVATQIPMISRILYLVAVDILAVGVAMRRSGVRGAPPLDGDELPRAAGADFARMTSHSG
jgi:glucokinase